MRMKQYIQLRNSTYYFRVRYPKHLVDIIGKKEFRVSLGTDSRKEADSRVIPFWEEYQSKVNDAERKLAAKQAVQPKPLLTNEIIGLVSTWYKQGEGLHQLNVMSRKSPEDLPEEPKTIYVKSEGRYIKNVMYGKRRRTTSEERRAFIERTEANIKRMREELLPDCNYSTVYPIVQGILKRANRSANLDSIEYNELCHTVLRAWIELEERALRRQRGDFNETSPDDLINTFRQSKSDTISHFTVIAEATEVGMTLDQLIEDYTESRKAWSKSTAKSYQSVFKFILEVIEPSTPIRDISRDNAYEVLNILKEYPAHRNKNPYLKDLTIKQAVSKAKELGIDTIDSVTVNGTYFKCLNALFKWAVNEGRINNNPFVGLKWDLTPAEKLLAAQNKKSSIPMDLLQSLFNGEPWASRNENYKNHPSFFWGPLIALFHGSRRGEIASLNVSDIIIEDGIPSFAFSWIIDEDGEVIRRYKNLTTVRKVPIHPELLKIGFLGLVERQNSQVILNYSLSINQMWMTSGDTKYQSGSILTLGAFLKNLPSVPFIRSGTVLRML
ncbi:MAG: hypothetical protein H6912_10235 [Kordiimonadaceae bacterium]|nr:hypothetical protein [Kordiimonadaceae bacterium]